MTITYPLTLPTHTGAAGIRITQRSTVAVSVSPFTGKQQAQEHLGQWFEMEVSLPSMYRDNAEPWISFFLQLNGMAGTFLAGDPAYKKPRGTITGASVNGAHSARAKTLSIKDMTSDNANLTANGDFESGDVSWSSSGIWSIEESAEAHAGSWVAKRVANGTVTTLRNELTPCEAGQQYIAKAFVKRTSGSGGAYVRIMSYNAAGSEVPVSSGNAVTSAAYSLSQAAGTIPEGSVSVRAELVATNTSGTVYADDVSLKLRTTILAGDYIQLGSGSTARLHKVIANATADGSGEATLDIWPALRTAYSDGATVTINNPVGVWRLASNEMPYEVSPGIIFSGITFAAREAL